MGKQVSGTKSRIMKTLIDNLSGTNRLIIIDEADQLTFSALQAIRKPDTHKNIRETKSEQ